MARDGILGTPLGQFGLGAVALVIGGALLFALIGAVSGDDGDTVAAPEITDAPADGGDTAPTDGTEADGTGAPTDGTAPPTTDAPTDGSAGTEPTGTETATDAPPAIDPATITIQVLNGSDDRADHDAVVACLEAAGYTDLITSNRARTTYAQTAVFYTAGGEEEAGQAASALGVAGAEEQPGNLSDSVPVHIVSGQDGSDLC